MLDVNYCIAVGSRRLVPPDALVFIVFPTCTARCLHQRPLYGKKELLGREMADQFCLKMTDFHVTFRDLLLAVNLRHGTDGFTSPPKEGVLRIFSP